MKQYVKRTQRDDSLSFKLTVVGQVEKGEMTYRQVQERYGIQECSTVLKWLHKYGRMDWQTTEKRGLRAGHMTKSLPLTPEQRIKEPEQQLVQSEIKAQFLKSS
ncbi:MULTISPECIES: hypothetical protein [Pantoea]|uniref:Transposase n=1 Tax=Pantoea brenneri TaxID=472694 RepID=A0ABU9MMH7_9GAMM|nr:MULTISPECIES: hypothetical protein [unclassified Pantoea]MDU4126101.1 hypothetical protein [Pantoea sp.]